MLRLKEFAAVFRLNLDEAVRITRGREKLTAPYVTVEEPQVLRGIWMPAPDAAFYTSVANNMDAYFQKNPKGNAVNLSRDALYMAFDPRIKNTNPLFVNWYELFPIYPLFTDHMNAYIAKYSPLVVGTDTIIPPGYCYLAAPPSVGGVQLSALCP